MGGVFAPTQTVRTLEPQHFVPTLKVLVSAKFVRVAAIRRGVGRA